MSLDVMMKMGCFGFVETIDIKKLTIKSKHLRIAICHNDFGYAFSAPLL
jgi:hypothetical protein